MAKESKTEQILTSIAVMQNDINYIKQRLDKINGNLEDYPVYKNRLDEIKNTVEEITKTVSGIKIKVWSVAGLIGSFSALIGIIIGKFIG